MQNHTGCVLANTSPHGKRFTEHLLNIYWAFTEHLLSMTAVYWAFTEHLLSIYWAFTEHDNRFTDHDMT